MTEFTPEQIAALVNGGNAKHNGLYLAGYDPARDMPEPSSHDASKLRDWLHRKYAQKQWFRDPNAPAPEPSHSAPRGQDGPRIGSGPRSQARRNSASGGGGNGSSEVRGPSSGRIPAVQPMSSVSLFHRDDECARPPKRAPKRFLHT